jgi:hypothetical protein
VTGSKETQCFSVTVENEVLLTDTMPSNFFEIPSLTLKLEKGELNISLSIYPLCVWIEQDENIFFCDYLYPTKEGVEVVIIDLDRAPSISPYDNALQQLIPDEEARKKHKGSILEQLDSGEKRLLTRSDNGCFIEEVFEEEDDDVFFVLPKDQVEVLRHKMNEKDVDPSRKRKLSKRHQLFSELLRKKTLLALDEV